MTPLTTGPHAERRALEAQSTAWTGLAITALCGITLVFYARLWLPNLVLIKRDAFLLFLPIKQYMVERLLSGELPQWFPYEGLGRPFLGIPVTGVFHPMSVLYLILPVPEAYRLSTLLTCLLGALGAFALGRTLGLSRGAALLSGIAFACSGYVVSLTENLVYLYSTCALPFFCAALEKALLKGSAWVAAPALIWASVFLQGDVQTGYYYGFIALLWSAMRPSGPFRETGLRLAVIGALVALLACVQLGPAASVFVASDRTDIALFHQQALNWSTHPLRLLTLVASPIGGEQHFEDVAHYFFGSRPTGEFPAGFWAESLYVGVPVAGLALVGAWVRRDLRVLALLGGFALWLALGRYGGLYEGFYHVVPLWSAFRYPEKLMGVVSFSAAMLAGAGCDAWRDGRWRVVPWFAVSVIGLGLWVVLRLETMGAWTAAVFQAPVGLAQEVTESAALAFLFSAGAAAGVGIAVAAVQRGWIRQELMLLSLMGLVTVDLARANLEAYHTGPVEAATFTPGLVEALKRHAGSTGPGHFRLMSFLDVEAVSREPLEKWLDAVGIGSVMARQALNLEHNAQFHLESSRGYLPGYSQALASFFGRKLDLEGLARYNVAYLIGRTAHFQSHRFGKAVVALVDAYDLALVKNPVPVKPRAYLSSRPVRAASPVAIPALLARPDFLSGEVDLIEAADAILPGPARDGSATIEQYAPEEVRVRVSTPEPAVLILLDAFEAGWRATLEDGEAVPVMRANALVRAVTVPAGTHLVTFTYRTPLLTVGALGSVVGILICAGLIMHASRSRRAALAAPSSA